MTNVLHVHMKQNAIMRTKFDTKLLEIDKVCKAATETARNAQVTANKKLSKSYYLLVLFGSCLRRLFCHWNTGQQDFKQDCIHSLSGLPTLSLRYAFTTQDAGDQVLLYLSHIDEAFSTIAIDQKSLLI